MGSQEGASLDRRQEAAWGELRVGHDCVLFEPAGIEHTGKVRAEITKERFERLEM